ncbi:UPF0029 domain-containing protein [Mycena chlorophos]|uniref:UPF0029 domain-containing protein n=1 Tax=Mycena chlorophos TaxID=658473 RepID=A0A8H6SFZ7_MYCCL|nr:UPF0029 domain-containing protein [Mycena chlorophos]
MAAREATFADDALDANQVAAYLKRIELPPSLAESPPSLQQLSDIYLAHHYHVPKDTTSLHAPPEAWRGRSEPIILGSTLHAMPQRLHPAYHRIVNLHAGGYCWANNPVFAALLRGLGYRVSECAAKVFKGWANMDPNGPKVKNRWGTYTHIVLVVDWAGSEERYVLDVGFGGGGCPIPVPLRDGATVLGLNPYEAWTIKHEPFPHEPEDSAPIDVLPGWTMYRKTPLPGNTFDTVPDASTPGETVHQYHFLLASITIRDIGLFDFYSQAHPLAAFTEFFLVTRLLPGTGGARRSVMFSEAMVRDGRRLAKVHTTGGLDAKGSTEARDVEYVEMETRPMRAYLEEHFGFVFEMSSNLDSFIVSKRPPPEIIATSQEIRDRASVFVAAIFHATTQNQALAAVKHLKNVVHAAKPASHELYAWRCMVLKSGHTGLGGPEDFEVKEGSEDDGEKWGGEKILGAMKKQGILDAVVVVSRWYGGNLLGPIRFTHIETCTLEVCRDFKRQEDLKDALTTLRDLDAILAELRDELATLRDAHTTSSAVSNAALRKQPDYSGWIDWDLAKAHRLIRARESAIANTKQLIAKQQQQQQNRQQEQAEPSTTVP